MSIVDLCLAWNWEHDAGFVQLLEKIFLQRGLCIFQVTPENIDEVLARPPESVTWRTFLDRASDSDPRFQPLVELARDHSIHSINPQEKALWTHDKATMHLEFLTAGLETPYTIILPPYQDQINIQPLDLNLLAGAFVIKPACGGGGEGVILEATSWDQVLTHRQQFPNEKYLIQAQIQPKRLSGRPAWFRILFCDHAIHASWWDPGTHIYQQVSSAEKFQFHLQPLYSLTRRIAILCGLTLFSTEIALTESDQFIIVDYVNDPVDLRLQSTAVDGVPDAIIENIATHLCLLTLKTGRR